MIKEYQIKKKYNIPENLILDKKIVITKSIVLDEMYDLLLELDKLLIKHNINYFISSGTLLGYQRHKGFIPWDNDVDICIFDKDLQKMINLSKILSTKGHQYNIKAVDPGFVFLKKNILKRSFIDISILSTKDNKFYTYGYPYVNNKPTYRTSLLWEKDIFDKKYIFPIRRGEFLDFKVNIPKNSKQILYQLYSKKCLTNCVYSPYKNFGHRLVSSVRDKTVIFEKILNDKLYVKLTKLYTRI